jgi:hypothetical protein
VGAVENWSKLHEDMGQVAMDGDWHHRLEGRSGSQDGNVDDEDTPTTTCTSALDLAATCGWDDGTGCRDRRSHTGGVAHLVVTIF